MDKNRNDIQPRTLLISDRTLESHVTSALNLLEVPAPHVEVIGTHPGELEIKDPTTGKAVKSVRVKVPADVAQALLDLPPHERQIAARKILQVRVAKEREELREQSIKQQRRQASKRQKAARKKNR